MPQADAGWTNAVVAIATEVTATRGGTFDTQAVIDMRDWDYLILRLSALSLPTATRLDIWPMQGSATVFGYDTDLGGSDYAIRAPKADFVASVGKVLPIIQAKCPYVKIDVTGDVIDAAGTFTLQYMRAKSA